MEQPTLLKLECIMDTISVGEISKTIFRVIFKYIAPEAPGGSYILDIGFGETRAEAYAGAAKSLRKLAYNADTLSAKYKREEL